MYLNVNETPALPRNVTWCGAATRRTQLDKARWRLVRAHLFVQATKTFLLYLVVMTRPTTSTTIPFQEYFQRRTVSMQFATILHLYIKNLWCPLNLGLVGKVMMDDSLLVNLSAPAWTPKSPFVNGFTWPGNAWNFVYPSWEDCLNHRSWRVENGGPSPRGMIASDWLGIVSRQGGGPVKTHLTTKALISNRGGSWRMLYQLSGRYIICLFFPGVLVLIGET